MKFQIMNKTRSRERDRPNAPGAMVTQYGLSILMPNVSGSERPLNARLTLIGETLGDKDVDDTFEIVE
jgi:hypothetical protein